MEEGHDGINDGGKRSRIYSEGSKIKEVKEKNKNCST